MLGVFTFWQPACRHCFARHRSTATSSVEGTEDEGEGVDDSNIIRLRTEPLLYYAHDLNSMVLEGDDAVEGGHIWGQIPLIRVWFAPKMANLATFLRLVHISPILFEDLY